MQETIKRIALGRIKDLFKSINRVPARRKYDNGKEACILAAILINEQGVFSARKNLIFEDSYQRGLENGWDGVFYVKDRTDIKYCLGYADGKAAWKEVNH